MTRNDELAEAVRRLAGAGRLHGTLEGDHNAYRRLERIMEIAGSPWTPGLFGREARLANFIEEEGPYDCLTALAGMKMRIQAVIGAGLSSGEEQLRIVSDADIREHGIDAALLAAPAPHAAAFRRALDRAGDDPKPLRGHDWRWHPAADRIDAPNPIACAGCGLIARRPDRVPASCPEGIRAPVHHAAPAWFCRHPGAVVHAAAGLTGPGRFSGLSLCGRSEEHLVGLTAQGVTITPWHSAGWRHVSGISSILDLDCDRADCAACIAAMDRLPRALADPHEWRLAGDAPACSACGIAGRWNHAFGCDGGRYIEWHRRRRKANKGEPVVHHQDWACPPARRTHSSLAMAGDGDRVTCFSCLRTGAKRPLVTEAATLF